MKVGIDVSQHQLEWSELRSRVVWADEAGFTSAWVFDHFTALYGDPKGPCLEAWTLLAALSAVTTQIRLGALVTGVTYRHPSLLAAEVVTVDHVSEGRVNVGLGAAWHDEEHQRLGFHFPPTAKRIERLEDTVQIIKGLLTTDGFDFDGHHFRLKGAFYRPRPVQKPHPPIWIGAIGEKVMIPLAARYADVWHGFGSTAELARKSKLIDRHAEAAGRDPAEIGRSTNLSISEPWDQVRREAERLREAGFTHLIASWPSEGQARVEEFADVVMPELVRWSSAPHQIDTLLGGWERVTAGWLVPGDQPVMVETGSQTSVPVVLEALGALGVGSDDLAGIVVTHIHLDHAGGVGDLARAFPKATVYVHPVGARHLADPSRLVASAGRVYGDTLDTLYGRLDPTPVERIRALEDGEDIVIGPGRSLTAVHSPGHASHHLALHDSDSGVLFAGDAVGVRLPDTGVLRPATPPPDFDLDLAIRSLHLFAARRPSKLALAHFGMLDGDPADVLGEAEQVLREWAAVAETAWNQGDDVAGALATAFGADPSETMAILNGVHSNAAGLRRWLDKRAGDAQT